MVTVDLSPEGWQVSITGGMAGVKHRHRLGARRGPDLRRRGSIAIAAAVIVIGSVTAWAAAGPYPLLVKRPGLRVYGPPLRKVPCPHLLPLPSNALPTVRRAVTLAMPPFEARLKLNGRDPIVSVRRATDSSFDAKAGGCGRVAWRRSVVARVRLPTLPAQVSRNTRSP
jgi:hypothetical protein